MKTAQFLSEIQPVRQQLEAWRRTRQKRQPIPAALWLAMAQLARVHGVSAVSRSLRVPYYGLRERVTPGPKPSLTQRGSRSPQSAVFVELKPPMPIAGEYCIELEQRDAKMTLRLPAGHGADPLSLIQAFWRRQR